ncbi:conserved hypothetical protein [Roseovarius sp. EC-HK134]|jgi:hypothetical protein|uniref:DUF4169 family protein n=1 Tax=Roseovarius TaxID=74030 RepID=UPI0001556C3D|nr:MULTISPECIES: DUF4169 family protein [Roseovarius]AWZ21626.1 Hypothetical protein RAK1035_2918 [Roseovarius sp. AK1035]EDM31821.1 hypothetical protein RTM1035_07809 [Roseovarius sp. TM1035]MBW4975683.1 DUF4169 family protein [Roseovarius mucosus]VVT29356.1 conserved hypothetical protein [Roseovarius sp. EC-SD190]VVT30392.1 conserved hypothetical protein [Roseovarius sp. EC-HK134]|tara:strand:+ start:2871 stop:3053 length:183 start_codon:yes stop_codon:yes gene_type:complete
MSDAPVNLNRVRKQKARAKDKARADENAARFGRTKAQKALEQAQTEKARATLDQHRRDED